MLPLRDRLPRRRVPVVNYLLIAANVLGFVLERAAIGAGYPAQRLLLDWGLVPAHLVTSPVDGAVTVLTSMFMHDPSNWLHIGGNLLFLWVFGDNVEDAMGRARYLIFYLLSGVAAAFAQLMIDPFSTMPMVGASGAIAGVLAAYGSLYPRSPITVINPIPLLWLFFGIFIDLPAWVVILEFFVVNLLSGLGVAQGRASSGVAFFAHLGGFVAGLILVRFLVSGGAPRGYDPWHGFRTPPRRGPGYSTAGPRRGPWDG